MNRKYNFIIGGPFETMFLKPLNFFSVNVVNFEKNWISKNIQTAKDSEKFNFCSLPEFSKSFCFPVLFGYWIIKLSLVYSRFNHTQHIFSLIFFQSKKYVTLNNWNKFTNNCKFWFNYYSWKECLNWTDLHLSKFRQKFYKKKWR